MQVFGTAPGFNPSGFNLRCGLFRPGIPADALPDVSGRANLAVCPQRQKRVEGLQRDGRRGSFEQSFHWAGCADRLTFYLDFVGLHDDGSL